MNNFNLIYLDSAATTPIDPRAEGDIIRSFGSKGDPIIHIIEYDCDETCFIARLNGSGRWDFGYGGLRKNWVQEFQKEVIGNIYDNPELIKPVDEF